MKIVDGKRWLKRSIRGYGRKTKWARGKRVFFFLSDNLPRDSNGDGAWSSFSRSFRHSATWRWSFREASRCLRDSGIKAVGKYLAVPARFTCSQSTLSPWQQDYLSRLAVGCCGRLVFHPLDHYLRFRAHLYFPGLRRFWHLLSDLLRPRPYATMPTVVHIPRAVHTV